MAPKRGLSVEEKRQKIQQIFHETQDVFQLKDVEKAAAKVGVVLQSVKEVLLGMVADDLVHEDRIGASKYYWAFPSEAATKLQNSVRTRQEQLEAAKTEHAALQQRLASATAGREDTAERTAKLQELLVLEGEVKETQVALEQYADNDPSRVEAMKEATQTARLAANRWLDNIWALKSYCAKAFEGNGTDIDAFFKQTGYTPDMDYI